MIAFLSVTLNIYMITISSQPISNNDIFIEDNFILVLQNIAYKIDNKDITEEQKIYFKNQLIEIIKKYPK